MRVAIVGATGLVGGTFLKVLEERDLGITDLLLFASSRSAGKKINFRGKEYTVEELNENSFKNTFDSCAFWCYLNEYCLFYCSNSNAC